MGELCLDPGIAYRKKPVDRVTITESAKAWDNEAAQALGSSHHRAGGIEAGLWSFIGPRSGGQGALEGPGGLAGHCLGMRPGSPCTSSFKTGQEASKAQS